MYRKVQFRDKKRRINRSNCTHYLKHTQSWQSSLPMLAYQKIQLTKKLVLLGITGVGKTILFSKCIGLSNLHYDPTSEVTIGARSWEKMIVDTPPFNITTDEISEREKCISQLQKLFLENKYQISGLVIVVNFERTDLMKKKIAEVYKYIRKFQESISIAITQWDCSENKQEDESNLRNAFRIYKAKNIVFISDSVEKDKLNEIFDEIEAKKIKENNLSQISTIASDDDSQKSINLKDTIFEKEEEDKVMLAQLNELSQRLGGRRTI